MELARPYLDEFAQRRNEWMRELRDPSRLQAAGKLHVKNSLGNAYCCLGVACEIHRDYLGITGREFVKNESIFSVNPDAIEGHYVYLVDEGQSDAEYSDEFESLYVSSLFTREMREFYALSESQQNLLISLNDGNVSFRLISTAIGFMPFYVNGLYWDYDADF